MVGPVSPGPDYSRRVDVTVPTPSARPTQLARRRSTVLRRLKSMPCQRSIYHTPFVSRASGVRTRDSRESRLANVTRNSEREKSKTWHVKKKKNQPPDFITRPGYGRISLFKQRERRSNPSKRNL